MLEELIGIKDIKKEIKRQSKEKKNGKRLNYNFLGFIENADLTREVEELFEVIATSGHAYYDWINGNKRMSDLIQGLEGK